MPTGDTIWSCTDVSVDPVPHAAAAVAFVANITATCIAKGT